MSGTVLEAEGTLDTYITVIELQLTEAFRSYSGYGKIGFDRRFRFFEISDYGETIRTWKHTEHIETFNWQTLVGQGAPAPFEPNP